MQVITDTPYTPARLMDLYSGEAMTLQLSTTRHPVAVPMLTLVILTVHRVGTAMEAPSPRPFWQALLILLQTK